MNSKRLLAIASLISKNDSVVDIGCDHAYLDIYLIKNKLCKQAVASDISEGALSQAKDNIEKYGLTKKIKTIVSDGLEKIDIKGVNTIVISGMGTKTALEILANEKTNSVEKIIIQSNNNIKELKLTMNKRGYKIIKELVIKENNKYYTILEYAHGREKMSFATVLVGNYNKKNLEYYKYLLNKNNVILGKLPKYKLLKIIELKISNSILKKYIKKS